MYWVTIKREQIENMKTCPSSEWGCSVNGHWASLEAPSDWRSPSSVPVGCTGASEAGSVGVDRGVTSVGCIGTSESCSVCDEGSSTGDSTGASDWASVCDGGGDDGCVAA